MKLTKIAQLVAVASLASAASVYASTGIVTFNGAVTAKTCDVDLDVNGIASATGIVELGTIDVDSVGDTVDLVFTPVKPGTTDPCENIAKMKMSWEGPALGTAGIVNSNGNATGSIVELALKTAPTSLVTRATPMYEFTPASPGDPVSAEFTAQLKSASTAGSFNATTTYSIVYE